MECDFFGLHANVVVKGPIMDPNNQNNPALMPNPSGAPPNYVNPPSLDGDLLGLGIALVVVSTFTLSLRLYANFQTPGKLGFDDGQSPIFSINGRD